MSDPTDIHESSERICDTLRKAREARGISIEYLAKELRLQTSFIEALESENNEVLPGETYMRVYLRSLCKYLALDPDVLMHRFFEERGVTGDDTLRKNSQTRIHMAAYKPKKRPPFFLLVALGILVVLIVATVIFRHAAVTGHASPIGLAPAV